MNDILKDVSMAHRIVVKVETSTLTYEHGTMNLKLIDRLSMVLSDLRNQGKGDNSCFIGCAGNCTR